MKRGRNLVLALAALFIPMACSSQTIRQADDFVRRIYAGYEHSTSLEEPDYLGKEAPNVFSPGLLRLIHLDKQHTPKGEIQKLDWDPICDCQDPEGLRLSELRVIETSPGHAAPKVTLRYPAKKELQLNLLWTAHGWRIDDIKSQITPSLRRYLR